MYTVKIIVKGQTSKGKELPIGHVITNSQCYRHCLPGFRNRQPIAEPVDDVTREKVKSELRNHNISVAARTPVLQRDVDRLADKLPTDEQRQFVRDDLTGAVEKASRADQVTIDSAAAYGINPTPPAGETLASLPDEGLPPLDTAAGGSLSSLSQEVSAEPPTLDELAAAVDEETAADEVAAVVPTANAEATAQAAASGYVLPD